jgi:hypothetical protein
MRLLALVLVAGCASGAYAPRVYPVTPPEHFSISGRVTIEATGKPPRFPVTISISTTPERALNTDADGRYRIDSIPLGRYSVRARALGYHPESRYVEAYCMPEFQVPRTETPGRIFCRGLGQTLHFTLRPAPWH